MSDVRIVQSLPTYASNGDELDLLVDPQAVYGGPFLWRCRYRSSAPDPYKWHVLGSPGLLSTFDGLNSTTSTTYAAMTGGPDLALPAAGLYEVVVGASVYGSGDAQNLYMSYDVGAVAAVDADAMRRQTNGNGYYHGPQQSMPRLKSVPARSSLSTRYKVGNLTGNFEKRFIQARPIRLGAG